MTDEEMAKERATKFADINFNEPDNYGSAKEIGYRAYYAGFLTGLKAGRPEWHDLRKDPGDLPKEYTEVLNDDGVKVELRDGHWRYVYGDEWEDDACVDHWCEIPRFEEE